MAPPLFNGDVNTWNTAKVTNMQSAFQNATAFNKPIGNWNTASVTNMTSMFAGATSFNQPINSWNVSGVTDMHWLFRGATAFNQPLDAWNTAKVTTMASMFQNTSAFNQPINAWNTASVTSMVTMFANATAFNQPLNSWDVSHVTNVVAMFASATSFNQPLNNWNTSNFTSLNSTFYGASSFNQNISSWNTSNVTDLMDTFRNASSFNQSLNSWDVSHVTRMVQTFSGIFDYASFNQPLDHWNTASVTTMVEMFSGNTAFDQDISSWNVTSIIQTGVTWSTQGLARMFVPNLLEKDDTSGGLSGEHQDALLVAWAGQSVQPNVIFNLGLKRYSTTGAAAITSLRNNHNWQINEQYQVTYSPGVNAIVSGTSTQVVSSNDYAFSSTTEPVTITPNEGYRFLGWSDGRTDNPRTDIPTDNLTVTADIRAIPHNTATRIRPWPVENNSATSTNQVSPATTSTIPNQVPTSGYQQTAAKIELIKKLITLLTQLLQTIPSR